MKWTGHADDKTHKPWEILVGKTEEKRIWTRFIRLRTFCSLHNCKRLDQLNDC
jgi:hypothetical protein